MGGGRGFSFCIRVLLVSAVFLSVFPADTATDSFLETNDIGPDTAGLLLGSLPNPDWPWVANLANSGGGASLVGVGVDSTARVGETRFELDLGGGGEEGLVFFRRNI